MQRIPWTEHTFNFDFPSGLARELITRLDGAPARAARYVSGVDQAVLTRRRGEVWSIQENIAHLADLDEALITPRLDQFEAGEATLMAADMTNAATWGADHNAAAIGDVLARFGEVRASIVARLDGFEASFFDRTALHPRLGTPMRAVDLLFFMAEHDDYHLARVRELI